MIDLAKLRERLVPELQDLVTSLTRRNSEVDWSAEIAATFLSSGKSAWPIFKAVSALVRRLAFRAARGMLAARLIESGLSLSPYDFAKAEQGSSAYGELLTLEKDLEVFLTRLSSAGKLKIDCYILAFDPRLEYRPGIDALQARLEELSAIIADSNSRRREEEKRLDLDFDNDGLE